MEQSVSRAEAVELYAGTLVRLLLVGPRSSAQLTSGEPLPDLADFAATPQHLEQLASLPFRHDELDADEAIDSILRAAGWRPYSLFKKTGVVTLPLATTAGQPAGKAACGVTLGKAEGGRRRLLLER